MTLFLSLSVGASGKINQVASTLDKLQKMPDFRSFMHKETDQIPEFMIDQVRQDLGPLWDWLPDKSLSQAPKKLI
jgi:hypothetical protein